LQQQKGTDMVERSIVGRNPLPPWSSFAFHAADFKTSPARTPCQLRRSRTIPDR
jgi:hypothetical protein